MIAVTGAAGYLGQSFKKFSVNKLESIFFSSSKNNNFEFLDFNNLKNFKNFFLNIDTVLHLAGPDHNFCEKNFEKARDFSTSVLNNFIIFLKSCGVKKIIFVSTAKVYKDYSTFTKNENSLIKESSELLPIHKYEYLKVLSEEILFKHQNNDFNIIIFRLTNSFGVLDQINNYEILLHKICLQIKNHQKLNFESNIDFYRDFIFIEDVIKAFDIAINNIDKSSILNLGSEKNIFISEILEELSTLFKIDTYKFNRVGIEHPFTYSTSKLKKYEFSIQTNFFNELKNMIKLI